MAEAVVSFAVERIGDLLISEARFLSGVKDKVLEIQRQLKEMQNFLKDADNKRGTPEVGRWVAEIRELALQTEDVLETYAIKVASRREGGHMKKIMRRFACIIGECIALHKIGSEIGSIQAKITNLAASRQTFGIQALHNHQVESSNAEEERRRQLRISYAHLAEKDFVGMEAEIKQLVSHLKNEDRGCEVVSVWGMGGQGKTTLVQKLYNHPDVRSHFQAFAWVCVTQKLERQKVLQDILQGLLPTRSKPEITGMGDTDLVQLLYKSQKELKCLVVIDDIWSVIDWKMLKHAFPIDETSGSKILLTTRNEAVANIGFSYKLRSLSSEEGWKLFLKKVFPRREDAAEISVEPKKEKLGRDMVRQCQGLPLAISVLGGILKNKNSLREWEMVKKDIGSNLNRGEGIEYDGVKHILGLSYDDLPFRLKQLFLYLGTFKEDEKIEIDKLYLLWIAEGMIPSVQKAKGEMLMDVAERYLVELAQRSLIQLELMDERGRIYSPVPWLKVWSCRIHDLIRDLCLSKGNEEDFLKIIDFRDAHNESYHSIIGMEARRLAIYMSNNADGLLENIALEQQHMVGQLRSLLFFSEHSFPKQINIFKDFKFVRVLKLEGLKFTKRKLSQGVIELIHLRYLSLKDAEFEELPSCIADLRYLETLDLRVLFFVVPPIIPDVLWKMKSLKHLYLPRSHYSEQVYENLTFGGLNKLKLLWNFVASVEVNKKLRFDGLNELELLWNFDASTCEVNDLMKLTNLQVLQATTNTRQEQGGVMNFVNSNLHHPRYTSFTVDGDYDLIQLLQCKNLNELAIKGFNRGNHMIPESCEHHLLSGSLTSICLSYCNVEAEAMVLLEKLPNLQRLELGYNSFAGNEFVCTANSFPRLIHLHLWRLEMLEKWRVDEGALPNISVLKIWDCQKLEMLPEGLKFLTSLRVLEIWEMPKAFNDRVRVMDGVKGQDFHKVHHIPNILIGKQLD